MLKSIKLLIFSLIYLNSLLLLFIAMHMLFTVIFLITILFFNADKVSAFCKFIHLFYFILFFSSSISFSPIVNKMIS